jgi:Melibiase
VAPRSPTLLSAFDGGTGGYPEELWLWWSPSTGPQRIGPEQRDDGGDQLGRRLRTVIRGGRVVSEGTGGIRTYGRIVERSTCPSGGGRVDLDVLERTDRVWSSDCIDPLERQHIGRWTARLIPPEFVGSRVASTRSQTTGPELDLADASDADLDELRAWLTFYKAPGRLGPPPDHPGTVRSGSALAHVHAQRIANGAP